MARSRQRAGVSGACESPRSARICRWYWLNRAGGGAEFLETCIAALGLGKKCRVEGQRLERLAPFPARAISARAFAPLPKLLSLSAPFSTRQTGLCSCPRGARQAQELETVKPSIRAMFSRENIP